MRVMNKQLGVAVVLALVLVGTGVASAMPYVVKLTQQGNNVVAVGSGAFDLNGLTLALPETVGSLASLAPGLGAVATGEGIADAYRGTVSGPDNFGSGGSPVVADFADGNKVDFMWGVTSDFRLDVPVFYKSGAALTSGATWDNASFATLGVTPGTYTWSWGTGADQSFTLEALTSVPEPAALGMFGLGLLLIGGFIGLRGRHGRRFNKEALS